MSQSELRARIATLERNGWSATRTKTGLIQVSHPSASNHVLVSPRNHGQRELANFDAAVRRAIGRDKQAAKPDAQERKPPKPRTPVTNFNMPALAGQRLAAMPHTEAYAPAVTSPQVETALAAALRGANLSASDLRKAEIAAAIARLRAAPELERKPQACPEPRSTRRQERPIPVRPLAPFEARPRVWESSTSFLNPEPIETKPAPKAYVWDPIRGGFTDDLAREDEARRMAARWGAHWGAAIRAARERCGWSQAELGARMGMTGMSISLYERQKVQPSAPARTKLLKLLGVTVPA